MMRFAAVVTSLVLVNIAPALAQLSPRASGSPSPCVYMCSPTDKKGNTLLDYSNEPPYTGDEILCFYHINGPAAMDYGCGYNVDTGAYVEGYSTQYCPAAAPQSCSARRKRAALSYRPVDSAKWGSRAERLQKMRR